MRACYLSRLPLEFGRDYLKTEVTVTDSPIHWESGISRHTLSLHTYSIQIQGARTSLLIY